MTVRRILAVMCAVATVAATVTLSAPSAAAAAPSLLVTATTVGRGGTIEVTAPGCETDLIDGPIDGTYVYRRAEVVLITGTGAGARLASYGFPVDDDGAYQLTVPGWVDPAAPATVAGWCTEQSLDDTSTARHRLFTYPDVAIDVTAGSGSVLTPTFTLDRSTAAAGQVLRITVGGCPSGYQSEAVLNVGGDLTGRELGEFVSAVGYDPTGRVLELPLNDRRLGGGSSSTSNGGPLAEGTYTLLVSCGRYDSRSPRFALAEPVPVTVAGTNPSGDLSVEETSDGLLSLRGAGCTGTRPVAVTFTGYAETYDDFGFANAALNAVPAGAASRATNIAPDTQGQFSETVTTTAGADGSWAIDWAPPEVIFYDVNVSADCGDPFADGFRYVDAYYYSGLGGSFSVSRVSPTTSPAGEPVTVHVTGTCDGTVQARFVDQTGTVRSESPTATMDDPDFGHAAVTLNAPSAASTYRLDTTCDEKPTYPSRYEVFAPTMLANPAPLPAEPSSGWPSSGARETYQGRIGPIVLDPTGGMHMEGMDLSDASATTTVGAPVQGEDPDGLPSSGIGISVPRPEGDFAINEMSFDLVDENGTAVAQSDAHLHHFVVSNVGAQNSACPSSTFGLPGEIVAASGAERTAVAIDDPYGIVVDEEDAWFGVYDVMNRIEEKQVVYLAYDMKIRRDVENVRPLRTYFGSASGCDSFTWDIDGSGTADVQSTYIPIKRDGVLVGTGAHLHNGGAHADMSDDRGRRLCRSELRLGDAHGGHGGHGSMDGPMDEPEFEFAPEFYPDDPEILGITNCQVREQVRAGERLRFDAVYGNERARSSVMGIYNFFVWEGGGPAAPTDTSGPGGPAVPSRPSGPSGPSGPSRPSTAPGAQPVTGRPDYAG